MALLPSYLSRALVPELIRLRGPHSHFPAQLRTPPALGNSSIQTTLIYLELVPDRSGSLAAAL